MSRLLTYDLPLLVSIDRDGHANHTEIVPGSMVSHCHDKASLGIALTRAWGPEHQPMQVMVLWSGHAPWAQTKIVTISDWRECLVAKGIL